MRLGALILSILLIFSLSLAGCSEEKTDNKAANKKTVVKKPIEKPPEEKGADQDSAVEEPARTTEEKKTDELKEIQEERFYLAKGDESLSMIAARKDVYGDPLKWIVLYRLNRDVFDKIGKDESFPDKYVPAETRLKISTSGEALKPDSKEYWAVNVLSSPDGEKIAPDAIKLVDNGFSAYITIANVKGHDYIRLRVGFYDEKSAADDAGQKIVEILNVSDLWTTRAGESEIREFGGYK